MNNTFTGVFITIGMFVASPYYALCMILGTSVSTITSLFLKLNRQAFSNGLHGYNGTLVGIGIGLFHFGGDKNFF
jgi:urea transporter